MKKQYTKLLFLIITLISINGCTGFHVQGTTAKAGETIAAAVGYNEDLSQDNITIVITDSANNTATYPPNHPAIKLVNNMYPDPISALLVSGDTDLNIDGSISLYQQDIENSITTNSRDLYQTSVFFDLPYIMDNSVPIANGIAHIQVQKDGNDLIYVFNSLPILAVEVIANDGVSDSWTAIEVGSISDPLRKSAERVSNYGVVTFTGSTVPHSIQLSLSHDPDVDNGGAGRAFITTPRGDIIGVTSYDDGNQMKVILSPVKTNKTLTKIEYFKFFVAGDITGWQVVANSIEAVDVNGDLVTGVIANLVLN